MFGLVVVTVWTRNNSDSSTIPWQREHSEVVFGNKTTSYNTLYP